MLKMIGVFVLLTCVIACISQFLNTLNSKEVKSFSKLLLRSALYAGAASVILYIIVLLF